ncbi:MAG TPA: histidinol-phosphate transaminase [Anaerolineales bacterium]|nr:histidinol-phosphate transaminase [Anaerolineales bacterium]
MKPMEEYYVPWLKGQKMYISSHIELAWRDPSLHRMMSNENPNPPSEKVVQAIEKYARMAHRYPDQGLVVRGKIAEINGLAGPENVMLGNGSSEIYDMIWRSLVAPGEEVIQHTPCFGIYKLRCAAVGGKLVSVPMRYEKDQLVYDPEAILAAITPKTKVIVVANPNNPTGNFMEPEGFVQIAETGVPFVVDEAYVEFAGLERSQVALTKKYKNVIITRTLSKAYGLAGLRFGYLLADPEVVASIAAMLIPWNLGTIAMWAGLAALEDTDGLKARADFNNREVMFIEESLSEIPGLTIFHSYGNYILFDGKATGKKGKDMVDFALQRGLIFRGQSDMYGSDGWFRITIGSEEENRLAIEAIRDFYQS